MRTLYHLSITLLMLGVFSIPGCIEFGSGIVPTIVMILIGGLGVLLISRYRYEK